MPVVSSVAAARWWCAGCSALGVAFAAVHMVMWKWRELAADRAGSLYIVFSFLSIAVWVSYGPLLYVLQGGWEEPTSTLRIALLALLHVPHIAWSILGCFCLPEAFASQPIRALCGWQTACHTLISLAFLCVAGFLLVLRFLAPVLRLPALSALEEKEAFEVSRFPENLFAGGGVGICRCPGYKSRQSSTLAGIEEDLRSVVSQMSREGRGGGVVVLVSLMEAQELVERERSGPGAATCAAVVECVKRTGGMASVQFPIRDKWIPRSMRDLADLVDCLAKLLNEGKRVVVHCHGGKGRSATVVAALLLWTGAADSVSDAVSLVRRYRGSGTLHNPLQLFYLWHFESLFSTKFKKVSSVV